MKAFPIDFVRQIIYQTLNQEHIKDNNLVGGVNQLNLFSFYEQLVNQDEVDRYVEQYRELTNQQNRDDLIANGIIVAPENPTITNLNASLIVPLSFMCSFRCNLEDRDLLLEAINNLIKIHKGRKVDICEFDNGKVFMVGTLGNNVSGAPLIKIGDYIGEYTTGTLDNFIKTRITTLINTYGFVEESSGTRTKYLYYKENDLLKVAIYNADNSTWEEKVDSNTYDDVIFPPEHNSFTKYKVSLSFDALRCDEPRTLNGKELITISFSGSATLCSTNVLLGNDLTKVSVIKYKRIEANGEVSLGGGQNYLEPLELPSSSNADTQLNRLMSNNFIANTHTDSLTLSLRYTFIIDLENELISQLYFYARYGTQTDITPNIIYQVKEYYCAWGEVNVATFLTKIVESIDIENTESDTMTITIPFQLQGANN